MGVKTVDVVRRMCWGGGGEVLSRPHALLKYLSRARSTVRQVSLASSLPLGTAGGRTRSADRRPCLADCRGPSEPNRHSSKGEPHVSVPRSAPLHPLPIESLTSDRVSDGGAEITQGQKKSGRHCQNPPRSAAQVKARHVQEENASTEQAQPRLPPEVGRTSVCKHLLSQPHRRPARRLAAQKKRPVQGSARWRGETGR